jgi:transcriptional regulator with XRE-family HTH domain
MTVNNKSELGRILKQQRLAASLTLQQLAAMAQVSASHIGRIERGDRLPSAYALRKLAAPLHMNEVDLMSLAGFLSSAQTAAEDTGRRAMDPYVVMVLSQEPVETQRMVVNILVLLKGLAKLLTPGPDTRTEKE